MLENTFNSELVFHVNENNYFVLFTFNLQCIYYSTWKILRKYLLDQWVKVLPQVGINESTTPNYAEKQTNKKPERTVMLDSLRTKV